VALAARLLVTIMIMGPQGLISGRKFKFQVTERLIQVAINPTTSHSAPCALALAGEAQAEAAGPGAAGGGVTRESG
jgi:hypothetical protein